MIPPIQSSGKGTPVKPPNRVLVADDSAFMRCTITKQLNETPDIQVVGSAHNGVVALALIPKLQPNVVTLDVEMPRMDGLAKLREIMASNPRPLVMLSNLTTEGSRETVQAMTRGAVDFPAQPKTKAIVGSIVEDVISKIQRAAEAKVFRISKPRSQLTDPRLKIKKKKRVECKSTIRWSSLGPPLVAHVH